jgi:broad specificity phosphatase PhoE
MPTVLYIVRHAKSARNVELKGRLFVPAAERLVNINPDHRVELASDAHPQIAQTAEAFNERFGGIPDVIIHSGYIRTKMTALGLFRRFSLDNPDILFLEDVSLRERESGCSYTMSQEEVAAHLPYVQPYWDTLKGLFARPVSGESLLDVVEKRLRWFIVKVWKQHAGKQVCLVTHGRVIQCLRYMLDDMTWEQMEEFLARPDSTCENCSVTVYRYDPERGKLVLDTYNAVLYDKTD